MFLHIRFIIKPSVKLPFIILAVWCLKYVNKNVIFHVKNVSVKHLFKILINLFHKNKKM